MRSFRTVLLFLVLFFSAYRSQAQFHVFAGPQISTVNYSIRNAKQPTEWKQGFMAGVGLRTEVEGPLYFSPLLYFSQKGYKVTFNRPAFPPDLEAKNNNTTINTITFAPLLQFNFSDRKTHVFARLGPAIDVAISGREIFDSTGNKQVDRSMLFGSTGYSPVTASANVHIGFAHQKGLSIFAHYEHGLSNLNNSDLGPMILHRIVGLSLGWKLNGR